jgi:RNA polymerase sigma factor (sigma-70 family)
MEEKEKGGFGKQAEATLYRTAQAGCPESLDRLVRQHEGLVRQIVAHQQLCGLPFEEAPQAGRIGLWRAIEGYDPQRGTRFSTYAYPAIIRQVWDAVRRKCAWERRQVPEELLGVYFESKSPDERQEAEWEQVEASLRGMVAGLPERQAEVIRRRYGLEGQARETLAEIGGEWQAALVCPDGQLHDSDSRVRCQAVTETCYQAIAPGKRRPCPAKEKGQCGCDCDRLACAQICQRAMPRDPQAHFVWYERNNQGEREEGEAHYGYRNLPLQLADQGRRFSLTLLSDVRPANQHEELPAAALLLQLERTYPDLQVEVVAGDAGLGHDVFLYTTYAHLQTRWFIDLRRHQVDKDPCQWPLRG